MDLREFVSNEWNEIEISEKDELCIKTYIDELFDCDFILIPSILTKKNGSFDRCRINCKLTSEASSKNDVDNPVVLVIYPELCSFKYDPNGLKGNVNKDKIDRYEERYIQSVIVKKIFNKIIDEFRKKVKELFINI